MTTVATRSGMPQLVYRSLSSYARRDTGDGAFRLRWVIRLSGGQPARCDGRWSVSAVQGLAAD